MYGLKSPLKSRFSQNFHSMPKKKGNYVENNIAASMRKKIAIEAFGIVYAAIEIAKQLHEVLESNLLRVLLQLKAFM